MEMESDDAAPVTSADDHDHNSVDGTAPPEIVGSAGLGSRQVL